MDNLNYLTHSDNNFTLVKNSCFLSGDIIDFNLYTVSDQNKDKKLLLSSGNIISEKITKFKLLYILTEDIAVYRDFIFSKENLIDPDLIENINATSIENELKEFILKIYNDATLAMYSILSNSENPDNLIKVDLIINYLLDFISNEYISLALIRDCMSRDYFIHTHSINVCLYSLYFGKFLGLNDSKLKNLGVASLLHDIGKSKVDFHILHKRRSLDENEYKAIKKHAEFGYYIARNLGINDPDILSGIKSHHEKMDGTGYPQKLLGENISLFAKIIGICDIFDAMSTEKTYRLKYTIKETLLSMKKNESKTLDQHILNQFILMFAKQ